MRGIYNIIAVLVFTNLLSITDSMAQTVHAILVGDTDDGTIGRGVQSNLEKMKQLLDNLGSDGGIRVEITEITGSKFGCAPINQAARQLQTSKNDAVIFYYAGHGYRLPGDSVETLPFPRFFCKTKENDEDADLADIAKQIESNSSLTVAPPRFLVAIADACNEIFPGNLTGAAAQPASIISTGLRHLLLGYSGEVIMAGAVPTENSYYLDSITGGGFFTNQLLLSINNEIKRSVAAPMWSVVIANTKRRITVPTTPKPVLQDPIVKIVRLNSVSTN